MELNIIEQIKQFGIDKIVEKYNLKHKDFGHKFSLKYDQLNTPKNKYTNECRGLVLSKDLEVLSMPFYRFSNYSESTRKKMDWESAKIFEKCDGTMIHYYHDPIKDEWCVGTTGSAETIDPVGNYEFTLGDLFLGVCKELDIDISACQKGFTYIFELATEYNMVVNKYDGHVIKLLGVRDLNKFEEVDQMGLDFIASQHLNCDRPEQFFFKTEQDMLDSLQHVKHGDVNFEGYVIVDKNFYRLKVKSNKFVIYHQFNGNSNLDEKYYIETKWRLIDIVLNNEIEEVSASFPELEELMLRLKANLEVELAPIKEAYDRLKPIFGEMTRKDFFLEVQKSVDFDKKRNFLSSVVASLMLSPDKSYHQALMSLDKQKLYNLIK